MKESRSLFEFRLFFLAMLIPLYIPNILEMITKEN